MLVSNLQVCCPKKQKHRIQRKRLWFQANLERVLKERQNCLESMKKIYSTNETPIIQEVAASQILSKRLDSSNMRGCSENASPKIL